MSILGYAFFYNSLIANRFRTFLQRYVNLARCSALGFFYEALCSKYFHSVLTVKKGWMWELRIVISEVALLQDIIVSC
jgi:hypothetical protein